MAKFIYPKTNPRRKDHTGERFGRWTAVSWAGDRKWLCICDCGVTRNVLAQHLVSGHSTSCGCFKSDNSSKVLSFDLSGRRFGRLTAIERAPRIKRRYGARWHCKCDCGSEKIVGANKLLSGATQSCGCLFYEAVTTHNKSRTRTYRIWIGMKQRCLNSNQADTWVNYGGRGINVCERWMTYENFLADMGEAPPNGSIERINVNGNYEPKNCKWIPRHKQLSNTRRNKVVTVNGQEMLLTSAIEMLRRQAVFKNK